MTVLAATVALALPASAAADYDFASKWGTTGTANGEFSGPSGLDTDSLDNVYVTDFGNDRVQVFTPDGDYLRSFATGAGPADVAITADDSSIYVANQNTDNVQKFDSSGALLGVLAGTFLDPIGVAVDSAGNVYVADRGNNRIQKFDAAGLHQADWGGPLSGTGQGEFNHPADVAVFGTTLYVADYDNNRIQRLSTADGSFVGEWGDNTVFNNPISVDVSEDGASVFVADNGNDRVRVFNAVGTAAVPPTIGSSGTADGQFLLPRGVTTGSLNSLFVTDDNNRVQKFAAPISGSSVRTSGTRLVFDAEVGRINTVSVSQVGATFTFTEAIDGDGADAVTPGAGCAQLGANSVTCNTPGINKLSIAVRNLDDTVTTASVSSPVAATINGGTGADFLTGGPGTDTVSYSDSSIDVTVNLAAGTATGGDTLAAIENATGSTHDDTFVSASTANAFSGGGGTDTVSYSAALTNVTASLATGTASDGDTFTEIENLIGSPQNDTLTGGPGLNSIVCGAGTDSATAEIADTVAADCESVVRTDAAPPAGGGGGGGETTPGGSTGGGGTGAAPAPSAPVLSGLAAAKMRTGRAGTFSYSLNKAASVVITVEQITAGRKSGSACKKQTRKNRKKRACTLYVLAGKLTQAGAAGRNSLRFSGKLGGRKLKPGVYRATAVATAAGGKSAPATAKFSVSR